MIIGSVRTTSVIIKGNTMDIFQTIEKPWREPIDYITLVFWTAIFLIAVMAMWDGMRILGSYVVSSVTE